MKLQPQRWPERCRVVVGAAAVQSLRAHSPAVPIVALVDEASPTESVMAQVAGADVVLAVRLAELRGDDPVSDDSAGDDTVADDTVSHDSVAGDPGLDPPGLDLAVQAACVLARRRAAVAATSGRVNHDLADALNVIALAADAGAHRQVDPQLALEQVAGLARTAGADTWRSGHTCRASSRVVSGVELRRLVLEADFNTSRGRAAVDVVVPDDEILVLADEQQLVAAISELIGNAEQAGADWVQVAVALSVVDGHVEVAVSDNGEGMDPRHEAAVGTPFNTSAKSDRLGLGLATIAEYVSEIGGSLTVADCGGPDRRTTVVLSLPGLDSRSAVAVAQVSTVDQAAAQADILEGVVRHAPLDESMEAVVAAIEHQLPEAICSVLLLDPDQTLRHIAGARLPEAYRDAIDGVAIGPGQGSCGTAAHIGQPVVASDVTLDHNWVDFRDLATTHGLRSCWSTPIVAAEDGEVLGTFAVYTPMVWAPDQSAVRLVDRFTYLAAVAVEHHRLFGARRAREAAEAANQAKSDFLALVSHELRTPLNVILGFAQVMQLVELDGSQQRDSVDQIVKAGRHLRGVIDGLLDLSHIESGELRITAEQLEAGEVIGETLDLVRPLASSRAIRLVDGTKSGPPRSVLADRRCLRQVLINLVDNAVKYTPEGGLVEVSVATGPNGSTRIFVSDSGPGIPAGSLQTIFEPFHRLGGAVGDRSRVSEHEAGGTGLGLALCVRLMQEMGGSIGVRSTIGVGSCFWLDLPRSVGPAPVGCDVVDSAEPTVASLIDGGSQPLDALN